MQIYLFDTAVSWKSHEEQWPEFTTSLGKGYSKEVVNFKGNARYSPFGKGVAHPISGWMHEMG